MSASDSSSYSTSSGMSSGCGAACVGSGSRIDELVVVADLVARLARLAVDRDRAGLDRALQIGAAVVLQVHVNVMIEPHALGLDPHQQLDAVPMPRMRMGFEDFILNFIGHTIISPQRHREHGGIIISFLCALGASVVKVLYFLVPASAWAASARSPAAAAAGVSFVFR